MKGVIAVFAAVLLAVGAWGQKRTRAPHVVSPADVDVEEWSSRDDKWAADPDVRGTYSMTVQGDPAEGPSVRYMKFDSGASIGWHWHPSPEMVFGDKGTLEYRFLHSSRVVRITSGSYARVPADIVHKAICVSKEPCTFYVQTTYRAERHMVEADAGGEPAKPAQVDKR